MPSGVFALGQDLTMHTWPVLFSSTTLQSQYQFWKPRDCVLVNLWKPVGFSQD